MQYKYQKLNITIFHYLYETTTWELMVINIHNLVAGDIQHNFSWSLQARGYIFALNYTQNLDNEEQQPSL